MYTEFTIIESRFQGKDLTAVQELQESQRTIARSAVRDNLQAQINLAQHIEAIAGSGAGHSDVHMKNIRNTRKREQTKNHRDYMKEGTSREWSYRHYPYPAADEIRERVAVCAGSVARVRQCHLWCRCSCAAHGSIWPLQGVCPFSDVTWNL